MPDDSGSPAQALSARERDAGPDETLYEGVPRHLLLPLQEWVFDFLTADLARRVGVRLRLQVHLPDELAELEGMTLLDVADLALQLDTELDHELRTLGVEPASISYFEENGWPGVVDYYDDRPVAWPGRRGAQAHDLRHLLDDAGSAFTVTMLAPRPQLVRRVDPTVAETVAQVAFEAEPTAGQLLRAAWVAAYGVHPDPTTAYRDAIRAVEQVACPLVLSANPRATLGSVRDHLRDGGDKWKFVLLDKAQHDDVGPVLAMIDRLWTGQVSRHGGGGNSREQSDAEGRAAVHLAATLMHLLSTGALTRR